MEQDTLQGMKPPHTHDSAPLFVSLYIVLLAFFIMLNTIATRDEQKIREASESVAKAFSFQEIEAVPEIFSQAGTELSATQFFNEMKALAASFVPVEKMEIYTSGNTMEIVLPLDFVYVPEKTELHPVNMPFFTRIADALRIWQQGLRIEPEILVSQPRGAIRLIAREEDSQLPIARISTLAEFFHEQKVAPKSIVPGLKYVDDNTLTLRFQVRDASRSRLNIGAGKQEKKP